MNPTIAYEPFRIRSIRLCPPNSKIYTPLNLLTTQNNLLFHPDIAPIVHVFMTRTLFASISPCHYTLSVALAKRSRFHVDANHGGLRAQILSVLRRTASRPLGATATAVERAQGEGRSDAADDAFGGPAAE